MTSQMASFNGLFSTDGSNVKQSPFFVIVWKEVADQVHSWRFVILACLILLTFLGSMYVSMANIDKAIASINDPEKIFYT